MVRPAARTTRQTKPSEGGPGVRDGAQPTEWGRCQVRAGYEHTGSGGRGGGPSSSCAARPGLEQEAVSYRRQCREELVEFAADVVPLAGGEPGDHRLLHCAHDPRYLLSSRRFHKGSAVAGGDEVVPRLEFPGSGPPDVVSMLRAPQADMDGAKASVLRYASTTSPCLASSR